MREHQPGRSSDLPKAARATASTQASVPPASMTSASPARISRKALPIASAPACMLEAASTRTPRGAVSAAR